MWIWVISWGLWASSANAQNLPDLFIGSIAVNPTVGPPGGPVEVTFEVRNGGLGNAGPFNVSIYFSTTATLDPAQATLLTSLVINSLNAGATVIQRATVTIPSNATVNQIGYLGIWADSGQTVNETNESNNATTTTFNVKPGPDLTVTALSVSRGIVVPGEVITVTYTIANIGRASVQPFLSSIYFSTDALIDHNDQRLDAAAVQYLHPGNTLTLNRNVTIPSSAKTNQTYFLGVFVDSNQERPEEDETNNIRIIQIQVVPPSPQTYPDFIVESLQMIDKSQHLGKNAYYTVVFKNQGQTSGTFDAYFDYSASANFITAHSVRIVRTTLNAGDSYTMQNTYFQVPWQSPYDQAPRDYYFRIRITPITQESDTNNNNSQTETFRALAGRSNLAYNSLTFTPQVCHYQLDANNKVKHPKSASGSLTIYNHGHAPSEEVQVGLYLSDDNSISPKDILVAMFDMSSIGPQSSITRHISFDFLATIPPGPYRFAVIIDPNARLTNDEGTQTRSTWLWRGNLFYFTQILPELTIDQLDYSPPQKAETGTRIQFEAWVRNKSTQAVNPSCEHRTYTQIIFAEDEALNRVKFTSQNYGFPTASITRITGYIDVPGTHPAIKGYLAFKVDNHDYHLDANPSEKIKVIPYELLPRSVDLQIVSVVPDPNPIAWEQPFKVDLTLANKGTLQQVTTTQTCVWFSYDKELQPQDVSLGTIHIDFSRVPSLTGSATFTAQRWTPGNAYLILQVDCNNAYAESDETNNFAYIPITIRKFDVDFVPTRITAAPNHIRPGLSTTVQIEVQNNGTDQHIQRVAVCIYFSDDDVFDIRDTLLACTYTSNIYNHFGVATFTVNGNPKFLAGTRYIFAVVDSGQYSVGYTAPSYEESDENNNIAMIPIYVRNDVDLSTGSMSVSKTIARIGENLTFQFQVKNIGTISTNTPFDVMIVFSDNEIIDKNDRFVHSVRIPTLDAGKTSSDFTISYTLPPDIQPGERYFGLLIDTKDEVNEVDETNNVGSVKVNVLIPGIDLQIRQASLDRSVVPAGKKTEVAIYSEVQNFGTADSAAFDVGFYLSTDAYFDPGDTLLATRKYGQVLPSMARTGQFVDTVQISLNQAQIFYILVVVDPQNQIKESLKDNNTKALPIQIINRNPTITSTPLLRAIEYQPYIYQAQAIDPDGDPITWRLNKAPAGMLIDAKTGEIKWTPQSFHGGQSYEVEIEVSDGRGGSGTQNYTISVQNVNDPPKIVSTPPLQALAGSLFTYAPKAIDPDPNDIQVWALLNAPTGMKIDTATGLVTWQVPVNLSGSSATVSLRVSDAVGESDTQNFNLLISYQNKSPAITSQAPTRAYAGTIFRYQAIASDPDIGDTLSWSRTAGPTALNIDVLSGLVTWQVPVGLEGQKISATIRVSDQSGAFAEQQLSLEILRDNRPPQITSKPPTVAYVNRALTYRPTAIDPDTGDQLSWSLLKSPTGMQFDMATGSITWTPDASHKDKSFEVSIEVSDLGNLKDVQTFSLIVGLYCELDSDCATPQLCLQHLCRDPGCFAKACSDPEKPICGADGVCREDLCKDIRCTSSEFCRDGVCVRICAYITCAAGQICIDGECIPDICVIVSCNQGQRCAQGQCITDTCSLGQCQKGRVCHHGVCVPDLCADIKCPDPSKMICVLRGDSHKAQCILPQPCQIDSECSGELICEAGVCTAPRCYDPKQACAADQICREYKCQIDPCKDKKCGSDAFCRDGQCRDVCAGVSCAVGRICRDGRCEVDTCTAITCPVGQKCISGLCAVDLCAAGTPCKYSRICLQNKCMQDACKLIKCPIASQRCIDGQCTDPPACQFDRDCVGEQLCVSGHCLPSLCNANTPCKAEEICRDGACHHNPCNQRTCPTGSYCREGLCVGSCAGVFCEPDAICAFGFCRPDPCADVTCASDEICIGGQCRKDVCNQLTDLCKSGRLCTPEGCKNSPCVQAPCPTSQICDPTSGQCSGFISCQYDRDCPENGVCESGRCAAPGCYQYACTQGEICRHTTCQKAVCSPQQCPAEQYCDATGQCRTPCQCPIGTRCSSDGCETDPCATAQCPPEQICLDGKCLERCPPQACKFGRTCLPGQGCYADPCLGITCPPGYVCRRGFCADPCTELRCPPQTSCQLGQCLAPVPEIPHQEAVDESHHGESTVPTESIAEAVPDAVPEQILLFDKTMIDPDIHSPDIPPPTGCSCSTQPTTLSWLLWMALCLILFFSYKLRRNRV
jgi:subtilase family serine protease